MIIEIFKQGVLIREIELKGAMPGDIQIAYRVQSKMGSEKTEQYAPKLGKPRRLGQPDLLVPRRRYESQQRKPLKYRNPEPVAPAKVVEHPKGEYSNMRLYDL